MKTELVNIKAAIYEMGLLFNQAPTEEKINAYANALQNYTPQQITFAFQKVILKGSAFFPSLAEILAFLRPPVERPEDRAPIIVTEMLGLLRLFNQYEEDKMLGAASEDARLAFLALGHTMDIRLSENFETTKAQLERLVKGVLAAKATANLASEQARVGIQNVVKLERKGFQKISFGDSNPEGA
jgi:hypothetical protein